MKKIKQLLMSVADFLKQIVKEYPKRIISISGALVILVISGIVILVAHEDKVETPKEENLRVTAEVTTTSEMITTPVTTKPEIATTSAMITTTKPEITTTAAVTTTESPETIKPENTTTTTTTTTIKPAKSAKPAKPQAQQKPSPKPDPTNVTLSLDTYKIRVEIGKTATIIPTVTPGGTSVSWESGEESIASVKNGKVTGVSLGATAIIVKAGGQEKRCTVIVVEPVGPFAGAQHYVDYAIAYGKSLGLVYDSTLGHSTAGWNQPVRLYAELSDEQMKLNIRHACEGFAKSGKEYFGVEAMKHSENPYMDSDDEKSYWLFMYYG